MYLYLLVKKFYRYYEGTVINGYHQSQKRRLFAIRGTSAAERPPAQGSTHKPWPVCEGVRGSAFADL